MELILDANVLVAGFLRSATTRELFLDDRCTLYVPEFGLVETEKVLMSSRLRHRLGDLSRKDVRLLLSLLTANVRVIPAQEYEHLLKDATAISLHKEDAPYLVLAIHLHQPLWSNDTDMKKQKTVQVYTTKELLEVLRRA